MSRISEYGYYVRKPSAATLLSADNAPCSAGEARDVVNNLVHLADEAGQVWACDGIISTRYRTTDGSPGGTPDMLAPEHIARIRCPGIRTRPVSSSVAGVTTADGGAYKLRVRIGGAISAAGTCSFYLIAGPIDSPTAGAPAARAAAIKDGAALAANETSCSTSSATAAWLTTTTDLLALSASQLATTRRVVTTYSYDAAGTAILASTELYDAAIDIFGWSSTNGVKPRLHALYCAEYVGS